MRMFLLALLIASGAMQGHADDLYPGPGFANLATDQSAHGVGDILTVIVYQNAEARNSAQNTSRTRRSFEGGLESGSIDESAGLSLDGAYAGQGEVRRSETFITQISVTIQGVLPNGDFLVAGAQTMNVNGERTTVNVAGRIRPTDISADNRVLSTRIADAQISYDGEGFVSRNARPSFIHRILTMLGLGG